MARHRLTALVLPGALYLAVSLTAHTLGQRDWFRLPRLAAQVSAWAKSPQGSTAGGQVVLLAAVLAASAGAGITAHALGGVIQRLALAADWRAWPEPFRAVTGHRVAARGTRWKEIRRALEDEREAAARAKSLGKPYDPKARHLLRRKLNRIALEYPGRLTWSGDRIHAVDVRLSRVYHVDLSVLWPPLWLSLDDPDRTRLTESEEAISRAATIGGWVLLYAPLALWWWPAALLAVLLVFICRYRLRSAADAYARLVEAIVVLHAAPLAAKLGIDCSGPFSARHGDQLTDLLDWPLPPPAPS